MKVLLVTRGSQGSIYPYLTIASELKKRGHEVTLNLPPTFEGLAKSFGINYVLQESDETPSIIKGMAEKKNKMVHLMKWMHTIIDSQFQQLIPLLEKHDLLVASNTEFSAASIAEYCKKPVVRTALAPFLPGKENPPPIEPFFHPQSIFPPSFFWKAINLLTNITLKKIINKNRLERGLLPVSNVGLHEASYCKNYLLYSRYIGSMDKTWKFNWKLGGYCFNDQVEYKQNDHKNILKFIRTDSRPTLFFTLGDSHDKRRNQLCEWLLHICKKEGYKLLVGVGWSKTGTHLQENDTLHLVTRAIPHYLIFPHCSAAIHHGGCGTTHSAARAGIPQFVVPIGLDQSYWGYQVHQQGLGPRPIRISHLNPDLLQNSITDLTHNDIYKANSEEVGQKIKSENGLHNFCRYIEHIKI